MGRRIGRRRRRWRRIGEGEGARRMGRRVRKMGRRRRRSGGGG